MDKEEMLRRMDPELRNAYAALPPYSISTYEKILRNREWNLNFYRSQPVAAESYPDVALEIRKIMNGDGTGMLDLRIYVPKGQEGPLPAVLFCHGGGCVLHCAEESDPRCFEMASSYRCVVVNVDYRLAPEHPAPAGQLDCCAAWKWLLEEGAARLNVNLTRAVFLGPSGGGNIVVGAALRLLDEGVQMPALLVPLYPMLDDRNCTPSSEEFTEPSLWGRPQNLAAWDFYVNGLSGEKREPDPYIAPARREDFSGFPSVFTYVGELEPFRDETMDFVLKLARSGVPVEFTLYPGCFHAFDGFAPGTAVSGRAQRRMAERILETLYPEL